MLTSMHSLLLRENLLIDESDVKVEKAENEWKEEGKKDPISAISFLSLFHQKGNWR